MDSFETVVLGGQAQDVAAPAEVEQVHDDSNSDQQQNEQLETSTNDADVQQDTLDNEESPSDDALIDGESKPEQKEGLTLEQRRENAALRKKQEQVQQQIAIEAEKKAAQARVDKAYADAYAGKIDPYTQRPITSEADYYAYKKAYEQELMQQQMKTAGLSPDVINNIIDNHPVVKQAQEVIKQAEVTTAAAKKAQAQEGIANELKLISALDPSIKTLEDLTTMENADKYFDVVRRGGLSLSEAFKLINFDNLTSRKTAAAKQAAINQVAGKGHLKPTSSRGAGGVSVPSETMNIYRELFPKMSDADFQKHWAAHNK